MEIAGSGSNRTKPSHLVTDPIHPERKSRPMMMVTLTPIFRLGGRHSTRTDPDDSDAVRSYDATTFVDGQP